MLMDAEEFLEFLDDLAEMERRYARSARGELGSASARGEARGLKRAADELRRRIEQRYAAEDRRLDENMELR